MLQDSFLKLLVLRSFEVWGNLSFPFCQLQIYFVDNFDSDISEVKHIFNTQNNFLLIYTN